MSFLQDCHHGTQVGVAMSNSLLLSDNKSETLQKISTRELAQILGVNKDTVNATVERLNLNGVLRQDDISKNNYGGYLFTEEQATIIKKEIQSHHNLQNRQIDNVETEIELVQNYQLATEKLLQMLNQKKAELEIENNKLKEDAKLNAPKVDFFNQVTESKDAIDIGMVAKTLNFTGVGRNKLFEILRNENILMNNNIPYQRFIDMGLFRVVESKFVTQSGETHINLKTIVYQKGVDYIRQVVSAKYCFPQKAYLSE